MFEENGTLLAAESLLGASPKGEDDNGILVEQLQQTLLEVQPL